jgi:integrase
VYPAVSLAKARKKRDEARELLAQDVDPGEVKRREKITQTTAATNTFEAVALEWLDKTAARRKPATQERARAWLHNDVLPYIGKIPIASIKPRELLELVLRKIEKRGSVETAHRVKQLCGQVMRFAVVSGLAERDITADLKEALAVPAGKHFAAMTEPKQAGELLRAIYAYNGHPATQAALKLVPMVFVRPGELRMAEWGKLPLTPESGASPARK